MTNTKHRHALRRARLSALASAAVALLTAEGARADGEFLQFDVSESTASAVVSVNRGPLTFGANHVRYEDGNQTTLNALYALPLDPQVPVLRLGPSLGYIESDTEPSRTEAGVKLVAEKWMPTEFGSVFLLAEVNTIDASAFALAQVGLSGPDLLLELSHGRSDNYTETTFAVTKGIGETPLALRAGYRFRAEELFVGFAVNTF